MKPHHRPLSWSGIYRTAAEEHGVVDTGVRVYLCPKFLDNFAEELRRRAAAAPPPPPKKAAARGRPEGGGRR